MSKTEVFRVTPAEKELIEFLRENKIVADFLIGEVEDSLNADIKMLEHYIRLNLDQKHMSTVKAINLQYNLLSILESLE